MKNKLRNSAILIGLWILIIKVYLIFQGSIESAIATKQLIDGKINYAFSQAISSGLISNLIHFTFSCLIGWVMFKKEKVNAK